MLHLQSGGIVFIDDKVVLRKSKREKFWIFPKGHVIPGETLEQAAAREVREETGLLTHAKEPLGKVEYIFQGEPYELHMFLMELDSFTDEWFSHLGKDTFLFTFEDGMRLLSFPAYKEFLRKAIEIAGK